MTVVLRVGGGVEGVEGTAGLESLTPELAEWATVSAAVGSTTGEARTIVRLRGEQLAARYAAALHVEVAVIDDVEVHLFGAQEPTPWLTGLTIAVFTAVLVLVALLVLGTQLAAINPALAVAANVLVVGGLAPSVWMCRRVPVWRWAALGTVGGVGLAWLGLLAALMTAI